jgi:hypothetical protein
MPHHKLPPRTNKKRARDRRRNPLPVVTDRAPARVNEATPSAPGLTNVTTPFQLAARSGRFSVTMVPEFLPEDPRSRIHRLPSGGPNTYTVTYVLSLPGKEVYRDHLDFDALLHSGDSLLAVPPPAVRLDIQIVGAENPVHITVYANDRGRMARVGMRIDAQNFDAAQRTAHNWISPVLSWWSVRDDVAIDVAGVHMVEERTDVTRWFGGMLGQAKMLAPHIGHVSRAEHRPLFASYREGLAATNPFYQALCFYRIIEGVNKLRNVRRSAVIAAGQEYRGPDERIPPDECAFPGGPFSERSSFDPYYGKKFTKVIDEMRGMLRNAVAHLDPAGDSLVADDYDDVGKAAQAIPVLAYIARQMLRNEVNSDPEYARSIIP